MNHEYDPFRPATSSGAYQSADDAWADEQSPAARHGGEGMEMIRPTNEVTDRRKAMSDMLSVEFKFQIGEIVYFKTSNHDGGSRPVQFIICERLASQCHADTQRLYRLAGESNLVPEIVLSAAEPPMRKRSDESIAEEERVAAVAASFRQRSEDIRWVASEARRAAKAEGQQEENDA